MIFSFLLILCLTSCEQKQQEQPASQKPQQTMQKQFPAFDGNKAYGYLKAQTDFGPRNPSSNGHKKCLSYLENELKKFTDIVTLQQFNQKGYNESVLLTNITFRLI